MTQEISSQANAELAVFKELFGKPPVLSTESAETYYQIAARLLDCFRPQDFMEQMLIKHLADSTWEILRFVRHKTVAIERKFRQHLEFQADRLKLIADTKKKKADEIAFNAELSETAKQRMEELWFEANGLVDTIDEILKRSPEEHDHARALEQTIAYQEQLDKLHTHAIDRFNDCVENLEMYRIGLGAQLRPVSQEIIDAECKDVTLVPTDPALEAPIKEGS